MAEVSILNLPEIDDDLFIAEICAIENGIVSSSHRKHHLNFVLDLAHESNLIGSNEIVSNRSSFGGIEHLDLGLGLGLGFAEDCNCAGFVVSNCGNDFCIARRRGEDEFRGFDEGCYAVSGPKTGWIESGDEDEGGGVDCLLFGINVVDSDDEDEDEDDFGVDNVDYNNVVDDDDLSVRLCWDSFRLEDEEEEDEEEETNRDFEWEEVDGGGGGGGVDHEDEDEEGLILGLNFVEPEEEDGERERPGSNLDWEVLLDVSSLDRNIEVEAEDNDDFVYTAEYEMMFGQFVDSEIAGALGRPPASKVVVEELPSVVITEEDVVDEKSVCAVCKECMVVGEECKQLPCFHRYHGDCIVPWLGIRNTCPVCRFELPTDDPDYEQRRTRTTGRVV